MKKRMTVLAMVMTLVLCLLALPAVAGADTTVPEGYPAIIQGLDFGGATVYIYDWWSSGTRSENPSETEALQYAYWDWLEATYNVHVVETAGTEWGTAYDDLATQVRNQDASVLCIRAIPADYAGKAMKNNLFASWTYGLDSGNFNQGTVQFMTRGNTCYGVTYRAASEPRQGVFFNKTILGEETVSAIYAAQAAGTWTWEMMEEYMEAVQQDTDNDGTIDIWGLTGNGDDITISLVISNGVDFYAFDENGKLVPSIDTPAMRAALAKRKNWGTYLCPSEGWNGYETNWNNGNCAFMIAKAYNGFSSTGFVATSGYDWGFVALPKGPEADRYVTQTSNNVYGIPNVYDLTTTLNLEQIFTLWTRPVPGTEDDAWATSLAEITNDADAIATYGMLRQGDHGVAMTYNLIGSEMETLSEILWAIGSGTVDEVIDNALDAFQQRCDAYNGDLPWSIDGNGVLTISGVGAMTSHPWTNDPATAASIQNVVIAEGVTTICENAFEGCTNMTEIHIPNSMLRIGGAFADCTSLTDVYYNGVETDWGYMRYMFPAGGNDLSGWNRLVYAECLHFAATEEADPAVIDVQVFEEGNTVPLEAEGDEENIYTTLCNANVNIVFSAPEIEGYTTTFRFSPAGGSWYDGPLVPENDGAYTYSRGRIPASDTGALYGIVLVYIPNDFSNPFLVSETKWIRIRGTSNGTATMELSAPNYYIKGSGSNGYTFSIDFPEEMIEHMTAWNVSVYSPVDYSTVFSDYETLPTTNHVSYTIPADQLEIGKKYEISINPAFAGYTSRILYKNFTVLDAAGEDISITLTDEEGNIPETLYTGTIYMLHAVSEDPSIQALRIWDGTKWVYNEGNSADVYVEFPDAGEYVLAVNGTTDAGDINQATWTKAGNIMTVNVTSNISWALNEDGVLTINGNGYMANHPWTEDLQTAEAIQKAVIEEGILNICTDAFTGCSNLTEITAPASLEWIDDTAFTECTITTVYFNGIATDWDMLTFSGWGLLPLTRENLGDGFHCIAEAPAGEEYPVTVSSVYAKMPKEPVEPEAGVAEGRETLEPDADGKYAIAKNKIGGIEFSAPVMENYTLTFRVNNGGDWWSAIYPDEQGNARHETSIYAHYDGDSTQTITIRAIYMPDNGESPALTSEMAIQFDAVSQGQIDAMVDAAPYYILQENPGENEGYSWTVTLPQEITEDEIYNSYAFAYAEEVPESDIEVIKDGYTYTIPQRLLSEGVTYHIGGDIVAIGYDIFSWDTTFTVYDAPNGVLTAPTVIADKQSYLRGEPITATLTVPDEAEGYILTIRADSINQEEVFRIQGTIPEGTERTLTVNVPTNSISEDRLGRDYVLHAECTATGYVPGEADSGAFTLTNNLLSVEIPLSAAAFYMPDENSTGFVISAPIPEALSGITVEDWNLHVFRNDSWENVYSATREDGGIYPGFFTVPKDCLEAWERYDFSITIKLAGYEWFNRRGYFTVLQPALENPGITITLKDSVGNIVESPLVNEYYDFFCQGGENINALKVSSGDGWSDIITGNSYNGGINVTSLDTVAYAVYGSEDGGATWTEYNVGEITFTTVGTLNTPAVTLDKEEAAYARGDTVTVTVSRVEGATCYDLYITQETISGQEIVYSDSVYTGADGQDTVEFHVPTNHFVESRCWATVGCYGPGYLRQESEKAYFTITETEDQAVCRVFPENPMIGENVKIYAYKPEAETVEVVIQRTGDESPYYTDCQTISSWHKYFETILSLPEGEYTVFVYADGATQATVTETFTVTSLGMLDAVQIEEGAFPAEIGIGEDLIFEFACVTGAESYGIDVAYYIGGQPYGDSIHVTNLTIPQPANGEPVSVIISGSLFMQEGYYYVSIRADAIGFESSWCNQDFQVRDNSPWRWRVVDDKTLVLYGTGDIPDFESTNDTPWPKNGINRVIVESGITGLGENVLGGFDGTVRVDFMQAERPTLHANVFGGGNAVCRFFGDEDDYTAAELAAWTTEGVNGATWMRLPFQPTDTIWLNYVQEYTDEGPGQTKWMVMGPGCPAGNGMEVTADEAKELTFDRRWVYLNALPTGDDLAVFSALDAPTQILFSGTIAQAQNKTFTLTTGTPGMLQSVDVMQDGLELTINLQAGETLRELTVRNAISVTVNGNIDELVLTNTHTEDPAEVTVTGDINNLTYYSKDAGNELFRGSLALKGTIAHMTVYGKNGFYVPGICPEGEKVLFDNLPCMTYTNITRNGDKPTAVVTYNPDVHEEGSAIYGESNLALTEAEEAEGVPVEDLSMDQFKFDYTFRENNVVTFSVRSKESTEAGNYDAYIYNIRDEQYNPSFKPDDMLRGEDVTVYITWTGTGDGDPVIRLDADDDGNGFANVYLEDCKAIINCPVTGTVGVWQWAFDDGPVFVTINNSVQQLVLDMYRMGGQVALGEDGVVNSGYCVRGIRGLRHFNTIYGACTLAEDGQLSFLTAKDGQRTRSLPATDSEVTAAAGEQLNENEIASMDINDSSEASLSDEESAALATYIAGLEADPESQMTGLTVESVIDISVSTYTADGQKLTAGRQLSSLDDAVPIKIGNDTGKEIIVVRLHDEYDEEEGKNVTTATPLMQQVTDTSPGVLASDAEVLSFESDLFSKYALVSIGWETDEDSWKDWEFGSVTNEYLNGEWTLRIGGTGAIPDYTNAYQAPWSNVTAGKQNVRIIIGEGVTGIGENAFANMRGTVRVDFEGRTRTIPAVDTNAFAGTNAICHYYSTDSSWTGVEERTDAEWIWLPKYEREYPGVAGLGYTIPDGETAPCWTYGDTKLTKRQAEELTYNHLTFWMDDMIPDADDATLYTERDTPWRLYTGGMADGTMILDAAHGGTTLELLDMGSSELTLTVDHSATDKPMMDIRVSDGKLDFTGDTNGLTLKGGGYGASVIIRGNIGELSFYNEDCIIEYDDGSVSCNSYFGDLQVIGTIGSGIEYGAVSIEIPGIGDDVPLPGGGVIRRFNDLTLTEEFGKLIIGGVFQRTDIPEISTEIGDYHLEYVFRDQEEFDDFDGIFLELTPKAGGERINIDVLANNPDFTTGDIIWGSDTDVYIHLWDSTPNRPLDIVLNGGADGEGFNLLFTNSTYGTITVNCPINALEVAQAEERGDAVTINVNSTVSGYAWLRLRGNGSTINLGENGEVHSIMLEQFLKGTRYVEAAYGPGTLYADGRLCVLSYKSGESLQSILPGDSELAGANGNKTTVMDISEDAELSEDEQDVVNDTLKATETVDTVFDVSLTEYADGETGTECHELSAPVQMAVANTTGGEAYVARLHVEDGELTMTPVSETTSGDVIWFESDLFSTYVIVAKGEGIDPSTLNTLRLPDGLTRIEDEAFAGGAFEAVIVPDSCTYIGHGAFANCPNLIYISYKAGTVVEEDAFSSALEPVVRE